MADLLSGYYALLRAMHTMAAPLDRYMAGAQVVFEVSPDALMSKRRDGNMPLARWCVWEALIDRCRMSQSQIARLWKVDHTSVGYGLRTLRAWLLSDRKAQELHARFEAILAENTTTP